MAPDVKDSSAKIAWARPGGLSENEDIVGYKVILYDASRKLETKVTRNPELELNNLTQFSKYYVTVQALSRAGYGPPSQQLTIQTKGVFEFHFNF